MRWIVQKRPPQVTTSQPSEFAGWLSNERRPLTAMIGTNFISLFSNQLTAIAVS